MSQFSDEQIENEILSHHLISDLVLQTFKEDIDTILEGIISLHPIEYVILDHELIIHKTSLEVDRFAESQKAVVGNDARNSFPELVGMEHIIENILYNKIKSFHLQGIARENLDKFCRYHDVYIFSGLDKENKAQIVLLLEDVTEQMVIRQTLLQASNETNLLMMSMVDKNNYIESLNKSLQHIALTDSLTNLANRRHFDQHLEIEWRRMVREQKPLALILADVDFFKLYNDTYGHVAGDKCLQEIAKVIVKNVKRSGDLVARYGGEEFAMVLPNTDAHGARHLAERIRQDLALRMIAHSRSPVHYGSLYIQRVSLSLGVVSIIPHQDVTLEWLIMQADAALYKAKETGRDRIFLANYS